MSERERAKKARDTPPLVTCGASRHVNIMADYLVNSGEYLMFKDEPEHCAESLYATIAALWESRHEVKRSHAENERLRSLIGAAINGYDFDCYCKRPSQCCDRIAVLMEQYPELTKYTNCKEEFHRDACDPYRPEIESTKDTHDTDIKDRRGPPMPSPEDAQRSVTKGMNRK